MLFLYAYLDIKEKPLSTTNTISWKECMVMCFLDDNCFLVEMLDNTECSFYLNRNNMLIVMNQSPSDLTKVAFKVPFSTSTCSLSSSDALKSHRYKLPIVDYEYQIQTSSGLPDLFSVLWIEPPDKIRFAITIDGVQFYTDYSNLDYELASDYCLALGDGLMPAVNEQILNSMIDSINPLAPNASIGLTKDAGGTWQWNLPNMVENPSEFFWAPGYPKPGDDCGFVDKSSGVTVKSISCTEMLSNMICHVAVLPP